MSIAFVGITLNIRNNRTYPIRINVLGSPFNPLDTANATTEYRWDITAFTPSNDDVLTLEYKPVGAAVFSTFTYQIYNTNTEALISALDSLGIGYFQSYTELGQLYLSTYNDNYVFGLLTITNNGTPATSTTTTSTTAAPTTSTTSTTTAAPTTSTTTSTTTEAPTTSTTTSTTTAANFSDTIGFGGAPEDACGFLASGSVTGDNPDFCSCTTFTGAIFSAAATGTWYVSFGGNVVSVSVINGNPVATVTSACTLCSSITSTTTTTTTEAPTTTTTSTTTAAPTSTTTTTTTAAFFTYALGVDGVSGNGACLDFTIAPVNYYSASASLADGVVLYQDPALSTLVPDNYYSDGVQNWLVTSGNGTLTSETLCSITTTTTSTTTAAPTSTTTTTTTEAPTTTTTSTTTAAPTTSTTTSTTTALAANIFIQNLSLDVSISQVDFGGVTATLVAGTLPNTTGNGTDLYTTEVGTYTLDVYRSNTVAGQHITVTDSNLTVQCIFFSNGTAIESFTGVVYDGITPINIEALDGAC